MQLLQTKAKEGRKDAGDKDHAGENGDGSDGAYSVDRPGNDIRCHCFLCLQFKVTVVCNS